MDQVEIMEFVNKNPLFTLGTCVDNVPHVRIMAVAFADSRGIVFSTGRDKDVCRQLRTNPRIEMCFYSPQDELQLRIAATAVEIDDIRLKQDLVEKFDFLRPWIDAQGYDVLITFTIKDATATTWTMADDEKPKEYISLTSL